MMFKAMVVMKGLEDGPDHYCECIVLDIKDTPMALHRKQYVLMLMDDLINESPRPTS